MKTKYHLATILILFARLSSSAKYYMLAPKTESEHDRKGLVQPDKNNEIYLKIKVNPNVVITPLEVRHMKANEKHKKSKQSKPKSIVCNGPICIRKKLHSYAYKHPNHGNKYMRSEVPVPSKIWYSDTDSDYTDSNEFEDLTRITSPLTESGEVYARELKGPRFSTDYLDLLDLKRTIHKNRPKPYVTQGKPWNIDNDEFTVTRNDKKGHNIFIGNKGARRNNYYIVRASDSDSSKESEENSYEVKKKRKKNKRNKKKKARQRKPESDEGSSQEVSDESVPKRFEVIDNKKKIKLPYKISDMYSEENSIEVSDEISAEFKPKKKLRRPSNGKTETYIQGGGRIINEPYDDDSRRRLPHFLPKQYLWDPDDYHKLGYFWFNGPQGKDPGPWRINF